MTARQQRGNISVRRLARPRTLEDGREITRVYDATLRVPRGVDAYGVATYATVRKRGHATRKEAQEVLARMIAEQADGTLEVVRRGDDSAVVYLEGYIDRKHARGDIREHTAEGYRHLLRRHLIPRLGTRKVTQLTPAILQALVDDLARSLSPRSIKHAWAVLDGAMAEAVTLRVISRNPCDNVRLPKVRTRAIPETTTEEVQRVLDAAEEPWRSIFTFLALSGCRRSEALGLTRGAVDLEAGVVRIEQGLHRVNGRKVLEAPKTERGRREIPLGPFGVALLRRVRAEQAERLLALKVACDDSTPVFDNGVGEFRDPDAVTGAFRKAARRAGVNVNLHGLRHYAATRMIDEGVDAATAADVLGHGSASFTLSTYVRSRGDAKRRATASLEAAFLSAGQEG